MDPYPVYCYRFTLLPDFPPTLMICLKEAMEADFDRSQLANESDRALNTLQAKTYLAISYWDALGPSRTLSEVVFYNRLRSLSDYIGSLLTVRYGCND
ncbi:hypothetical protein GO730_20770 [Spirosoma sp. HMF3257]|uniref:hypothetical protein n=1 Tax=Spirosoma telluris TaxID=2183553 RepID=UPI0011B93C2B|nr:hypothetical protein [Spirosoma telluris]